MTEINLSEEIKNTLLFNSLDFEPWTLEEMEGRKRTLTFVQKNLLGEISRFNCHDIIVWRYSYPSHPNFIKSKWKGDMGSFLTRFVFLHPEVKYSHIRKSLWWGLKGYLDIIICPFPWRETTEGAEEIADLLPLFRSIF